MCVLARSSNWRASAAVAPEKRYTLPLWVAMNSTSSLLTSSGCSCCGQCPASVVSQASEGTKAATARTSHRHSAAAGSERLVGGAELDEGGFYALVLHSWCHRYTEGRRGSKTRQQPTSCPAMRRAGVITGRCEASHVSRAAAVESPEFPSVATESCKTSQQVIADSGALSVFLLSPPGVCSVSCSVSLHRARRFSPASDAVGHAQGGTSTRKHPTTNPPNTSQLKERKQASG